MGIIKYFCYRNKIYLPDEIEEFFNKIFEISEIRGCVGKCNSIKFEIRTKERNHNNPHVHASYAEYSISIDIITLECKGNMPNKKQKEAIIWVKKNREKLLNDWKNIAITCDIPYTMSQLK